MKILVDRLCWNNGKNGGFFKHLLKEGDIDITLYDEQANAPSLQEDGHPITSDANGQFDFYISDSTLPSAVILSDVITIALTFDLIKAAETASGRETNRYWKNYDYIVGAMNYPDIALYQPMFQIDQRCFIPLINMPAPAQDDVSALVQHEMLCLKSLEEEAWVEPFAQRLRSILDLCLETPVVSIITITYNLVKNDRVESIKRCLESVHNQTYRSIEHIVVDGASADGTLKILNDYQNMGWIDLHSERDNGVYDAMNKGLKLASGKYIVFLNSDDCYNDNEAVARAVRMLESRQADYAYGDAICSRDDGLVVNWYGHVSMLPYANNYCHQTLFVKTEIMRHFGGFQTQYKVSADSQVMIRLYTDGYKACKINHAYVNYRLGGLSGQSGDTGKIDHGTAFYNLIGRKLGCTLDECIALAQRDFLYHYSFAHQADLLRRLSAAFDIDTITEFFLEKHMIVQPAPPAAAAAAAPAVPVNHLREWLKQVGHMRSEIVVKKGQAYRIYYVLKWIPVRKKHM